MAALSRWTNVMSGMKRAALGCALGGIIPEAFALLSALMGLYEEKVQEELAQALAKEARGGGEPRGVVKALFACGEAGALLGRAREEGPPRGQSEGRGDRRRTPLGICGYKNNAEGQPHHPCRSH